MAARAAAKGSLARGVVDERRAVNLVIVATD
jgi:hypothetical protein